MKINHRIRGVILIFLAIALFLGAWVVTNYIQAEKLYPRPDDDFDFHIFQRYESECFKIYDVDLLFSKDSKNLLVTTAFEKKCNFTYSIPWIKASGKVVGFDNEENLTFEKWNLTTPGNLRMEINSSSMELYEIYPIRVQYELNKPNFNFYRFSSDVNGGTSIKNLQYNFKNSFEFHPEKILKFEFKDVITDGFNCDENCFVIYDGKDKVEDEKPLFWGYHKDFYFKDGTEYFSFRFSPKSNFWLFIQKTIDLLVFGLIVLLLYEGFKTLLKNNNSKTKFKIVRLKKNNKKKQT